MKLICSLSLRSHTQHGAFWQDEIEIGLWEWVPFLLGTETQSSVVRHGLQRLEEPLYTPLPDWHAQIHSSKNTKLDHTSACSGICASSIHILLDAATHKCRPQDGGHIGYSFPPFLWRFAHLSSNNMIHIWSSGEMEDCLGAYCNAGVEYWPTNTMHSNTDCAPQLMIRFLSLVKREHTHKIQFLPCLNAPCCVG